ncbi:HAD family hydrolase [Sulfurimonas sp.]|uniref:HAD family hydrolase n=1 Tax=Sulfurimonas sp. TaxID=2022749 RepID=UPI00261C022B|nr:HAD family hydrolase [Sulfurimonas sp.]
MIILFDLDGTLIDSTEAILESFHNSYDVYNEPHPEDEKIKSLIGHPLDVMYRGLGIQEEKIWDYVAAYKEHYRVISTQKTLLLSRAKEAIELASSFAELGIVTTKTGKYSKVLMEYFGVMDKFDVLIGREDVKHPKPHEEPILKALEKFETKDKEIWMIGDTQMDLVSASNAKIHSIGVLSGYDKEEILKKYTNIVVSDSLDAVSYLKSRKFSQMNIISQ